MPGPRHRDLKARSNFGSILSRPLPLVACLAYAVSVAEGAETIAQDEEATPEEAVRVRDFFVVPAAQLKYSEQTLRLHPKSMLEVGYDSNVYASKNSPIADAFVTGLAGLESRYWGGASQRAFLDVEVEGKAFQHRHERNSIDLRIRGQYELDQSDSTTYRVSVRHERTDDPLLETGRPTKRGTTDVGLQSSWSGAYSGASLRTDYQNAIFLENDSSTAAHERDSHRVSLTATGSYRTGTISEFRVRASVGRREYTAEGKFQDDTEFIDTLGWRTTILTRISFDAEAGVTALLFSDDFNHDPAYADKTAIGPVFAISAKWDPEPLTFVHFTLYRELVPSVHSNSTAVLGMESYARYRLLLNAALLAGFRAYRFDSSGSAAGIPRERRQLEIGLLGAEYYLREGMVTRIVGTFETNHARVGNDYNRSMVTLELAVAY